jgi:hypothetical protein
MVPDAMEDPPPPAIARDFYGSDLLSKIFSFLRTCLSEILEARLISGGQTKSRDIHGVLWTESGFVLLFISVAVIV